MDRLPVEVFDIIHGYLIEDSADATLALRLVSRHFETLLFDRFNKKYFTTRNYGFSRRGLQAMTSVSQHVSFGPTARKLTLRADTFLDAPHGLRSASNPDELEDIHIEDPWSMESGDLDLAMITAALSSFKNVERIRVRGPEQTFDISVHYSAKISSVMHATTRLLQCIATVQPHLSHFKVDNGGMFADSYGIDLWALNIPKPVREGLRGVFNGLRSLTLDLRNEKHLYNEKPQWSADRDATVMCDFLSCSPNLSSLKLYLSEEEDFENRLEVCTRVARTYRSPNLDKLVIGRFELEVQDWVNLLANHKATLKHLELLLPRVTGGGVSPLFRVIGDTLSLEYVLLADVLLTEDEEQVVFPDDLATANRRIEMLEKEHICQDEYLEVTGSENIKRAMTRAIDAHYLE